MRARVGVAGYAQETNAQAAPCRARQGLRVDRLSGDLASTWEAGPLVRRLHDGGAEVVPLPILELPATGPLEHQDFGDFVEESLDALRLLAPLSALVVLGHGAGATTEVADADGAYLQALRACVGPSVPIVVVLDLHANCSAAMVGAVDAVVGYRTNPHVDIADRLVEAAEVTFALLDGRSMVVAWRSLPLLLSQLSQLTSAGEPLGEVIAAGQRALGAGLINCSVFGGFSLGDSPDAGVSVTITAESAATSAAEALAEELAEAVWERRTHFRTATASVAAAIEQLRATDRRLLLAEVADNPGGGAPANATALLAALVEAQLDGIVFALQCDPGVVAAATRAGLGQQLRVCFNEGSTDPLAAPLEVEVEVVALVDGPAPCSIGVYAGATRWPGPCAVVRNGGLDVAVSSRPVQAADPDLFHHVGLDPAAARAVVVKSRGHFRAGFAELFDDAAIIEVSAPGVAPVDLALLSPVQLRRPIAPLDRALWDRTYAQLTDLVRTTPKKVPTS